MHDKELTNLFVSELSDRCEQMGKDLLALEKEPERRDLLDSLMRSAHSIKGGARVVGFPSITKLCHAIEECFIAAIKGNLTIDRPFIDLFLQAIDALQHERNNEPLIQKLEASCQQLLKNAGVARPLTPITATPKAIEEHDLKVDPAYLDRLARLASGTIIDSRWLQPFRNGLSEIHDHQRTLSLLLEKYREAIVTHEPQPVLDYLLRSLTEKIYDLQNELNARVGDFELFQERHTSLSEKLYQEILRIRMRPFEEGIKGIPRLVRDLSHQLGKKISLIIQGEKTPVDREILERLENPIIHLVRNAIDHGIQKEGTITIVALHRSGLLEIRIKDNGQGIDTVAIRKEVEKRGLSDRASTLSEKDLENYIFQPGFTTKENSTEISGRGFGLDIVRDAIQKMGGQLRITSEKGKGVEITLTLPLTLSLLRTLIVEVDGEPYAFPLNRIEKAIRVNNEHEAPATLLSLKALLKDPEEEVFRYPLDVVMIEGHGVAVDAFVGEKELVIQELDPRLGKIKGILAGALLEDGSPLLILDADQLIGARLKVQRVLVVDDSPTIREMLSRILIKQGYEVDTASDGQEGLTHAKAVPYDLVITDLTMPLMDGYEMIEEIRKETRLKQLPIIVVSSRYLEEDIQLAHRLGANRYLTKGDFQEHTFVKTVEEFLK